MVLIRIFFCRVLIHHIAGHDSIILSFAFEIHFNLPLGDQGDDGVSSQVLFPFFCPIFGTGHRPASFFNDTIE